jgi:hypothetical protein
LSERKWQNAFADKFQWLAITTRLSGANGWLFIWGSGAAKACSVNAACVRSEAAELQTAAAF